MATRAAQRPASIVRLVTATLLATAVAVGCGGQGDSDSAADTNSLTAPETPARAALSSAGTPVASSTPGAPAGTSPTRPAKVEKCWGRRPTIVGTRGDDTITATRKRDTIVTLDGDDRVSGLSKHDAACTGNGDDTVDQSRGNMVWLGMGPGDDVVRARGLALAVLGPGDDRLHASKAYWEVVPGPGDDVVVGPKLRPRRPPEAYPCIDLWNAPGPVHVDLAAGTAFGEGRDRLRNIACVYGSRYGDVMSGTPGRDSISPGAGADLVRTWGGDDVVNGYGGDDRIYAGAGDDYVNGEDGNDRLYGEAGNDTLEGWTGADYLDGSVGDDEVYAAISCEISGNSYGTGGTMDEEPNEVFGGPGNDYVTGDLGNDRVDGGTGDDVGQGGYRDGRADWIESIERLITGCAESYNDY